MSRDVVELHAIIKGYVQGVFFRATATKHAQSLGLVGSVANLPDGTVELYAQGTQNKLEQLLQLLKEQPGKGRVDSIQITYTDRVHTYQTFEIISSF